MMVGFKYYSNSKVGLTVFLAVVLIVFLVTIRADHLFIFALPKPVLIHIPPPTPSQICASNITSSIGLIAALSKNASSALSSLPNYASNLTSASNRSAQKLSLLYKTLSDPRSYVYNLGQVSGVNLSAYPSNNTCSLGNINQNVSQAEILGVLHGYGIGIFRNYSSIAEFNKLGINSSDLPSPLWPNASRYISINQNYTFMGLYSIALVRAFEGSLNATSEYISSTGLMSRGQQSLSLLPNSSLGGIMLSYIPKGYNLTMAGAMGYQPQSLAPLLASSYNCITLPYQSNACGMATQDEKRLILYELYSEQSAGYSIYSILYKKSLNPSIALAAYADNSLVLDIGNAPPGSLSNATIEINGDKYNYTRFLSYFYVNSTLPRGINNISFQTQTLKLDTWLYVNPGIYAEVGQYETNGTSELSLYNPSTANISIYNLRISNSPRSNVIVPFATIQSSSNLSIRFTGSPCNSTLAQLPVYASFNSSKGNAHYYTTVACG